MLLEYNTRTFAPEAYLELLPCLLVPVLWERPANVSPLARLLSAYARQAATDIVSFDKLVVKFNYSMEL